MGFEVPEPRATIVLTDPPYAGAEIDAAVTLSTAPYYATRQWMDQMRSDESNDEEIVAAMREISALFIEHARPTWNLTRSGRPIPTTVDGIASLGIDLVSAIVVGWIGLIGRVAVPLGETSTPGKASRTKRTRK